MQFGAEKVSAGVCGRTSTTAHKIGYPTTATTSTQQPPIETSSDPPTCVSTRTPSAAPRSTRARYDTIRDNAPIPSIFTTPKKCFDREGNTKLTYKLQGKLYVRGDSKIFRFQNGKTESLFLQRKNPRRIAWTTLYRRMHKKGISEVRHTPCHIIIGNQAPSQTRLGKRDGSAQEHRLT